jgi:hypothetical protein
MVMVFVMFPMPVVIPVAIMIPVVIVLDTAAVSFPIASIVLAALIARRHPVRAVIRRASPITVVPFVMVSYRIPVTIDPCIIRAWTRRNDADNRSRRRRADSDSKRNLSAGRRRNTNQQRKNERCCDD